MKAELILAAQAKLGIDALTPGDGDLAFGLDFLVASVAKHELPYVSANLARTGGGLAFPATRIVEVGGVKVGLTGAIGEQFGFNDAEARPVDDALKAAVSSLRAADVDLVVLLSHLGLEGDRAVAVSVPGIDVIFGANDRRHQETPVIVGRTAIFQAGSRAKYVGKVTFDLVEGATGWADDKGRAAAIRQRDRTESQVKRYEKQLAEATDEAGRKRLERVLTFARKRLNEFSVPEPPPGPAHRIESTKIPMNTALADEPAMKALVDATLEKMGPEIGGEKHGVGDGHGHGASKKRPTAGPWVTSRQCRSCHNQQYKDWSQSGHAHAYASLMTEKRHFDHQCWSCHVTAAGQPGGPQTPTEVGPLRNVQCEACHGPGEKHLEKPVAGNIALAPSEKVCLQCHTEEQTEGAFDFDTYLAKIDHKP